MNRTDGVEHACIVIFYWTECPAKVNFGWPPCRLFGWKLASVKLLFPTLLLGHAHNYLA